jgi:hypothetical protein
MQRIKIISSEFNKFNQRVVKFLGLGKNDTKTAVQISPPGTDSSPIKGMVAVYSRTASKDGSVVVGYLLKDLQAKPGEHRTFSTNTNGDLKFYIWQKDDGTCEIGGNAKNMVRYQELETAFNALKDAHNKLVDAFNQHMHPTAGTGPPSIATPIPTLIPAVASTADITPAKINEIKTL